jgi:hypothetical protein
MTPRKRTRPLTPAEVQRKRDLERVIAREYSRRVSVNRLKRIAEAASELAALTYEKAPGWTEEE